MSAENFVHLANQLALSESKVTHLFVDYNTRSQDLVRLRGERKPAPPTFDSAEALLNQVSADGRSLKVLTLTLQIKASVKLPGSLLEAVARHRDL